MSDGPSLSGAGQAHRSDDHERCAFTALVNVHFARGGIPRQDWTLLAPLRVGEPARDRLSLAIEPELMRALITLLDEIADVAPTRSGKTVRARLRQSEGTS